MEMLARIFRNIVEAFLGTPRRVQGTTLVALVVVAYLNPGLVTRVTNRALEEMRPLITTGLVVGVFYFIFLGGRRRR